MILLTRDDPERGLWVIAVFGAGLVGSGIASALATSRAFEARARPVDWRSPSHREADLARIGAELRLLLGSRSDVVLRTVWAAGRTGLASRERECAEELEGFQGVARLAQGLAREHPAARHGLLLVSSVGGVFEGQRIVGSRSTPSPRRPYGRLKLRQEALLGEAGDVLVGRIVRLTSVYGYIRPRRRLGLVPTLIHNGIRQAKTRIVGRMDTLRDFVWIGDVSRHLSGVLQDEAGWDRPPVLTLGSGKPSSLAEIHRVVEQTLGRRIYVSYSLDPANEADVSIDAAALPAGWLASDLRSNVQRIYRDALSRGVPPTASRADPGAAGRAA